MIFDVLFDCRFIDADADGYDHDADCDDQDPDIHPDAEEVCGDLVDNNCNGEADEPPCLCTRGNVRGCYTGPEGTEG